MERLYNFENISNFIYNKEKIKLKLKDNIRLKEIYKYVNEINNSEVKKVEKKEKEKK